jgi:nucleotide-binding universal stress UspA family protein
MTERYRPRKILVVVDARAGQVALESALTLAQAHDAGLEAISCVQPPQDLSILARLSGTDPDSLVGEAVQRTRAAMQARLQELLPGRPVDLTVAVGKAYLEIIRHVARTGCDFVVKEAEPLLGMDRFLLASTDQHLLRKCPCPVWLQTAGAGNRPRRILAAVDLDIGDAEEPATLTGLNRRIMDAACAIAAPQDAEVIVLHAWDAPGEGMIWAFSGGRDARISADRYVNEILSARREDMDRFVAELRREIGPHPRLVPLLARGTPETVIQDKCREVGAEAVVMGTVARTGLRGVFIGNTAENIINSLDRPVLAVKPEGFVSPLMRE